MRNNVTVAKPSPESYASIILQKKRTTLDVLSDHCNWSLVKMQIFMFWVNGNLQTVCIGAFTVSKQPLGVTIIPIEWATELRQYLLIVAQS